MVVKGHDFPNVTLVGVICADTLLHLPDFRSSERTFQLLTQAAGRAGRGVQPGRVIIQTFNPLHESLCFAKNHDTNGFLKQEIEQRKEPLYPPFSKLIHFKTSHHQAHIAQQKLQELLKFALQVKSSNPKFKPIELLGPSVAPLSKIKDKYRFHLLLKSPSHQLGRQFMAQLLAQNKELFRPPAIQIDVDPLNLL